MVDGDYDLGELRRELRRLEAPRDEIRVATLPDWHSWLQFDQADYFSMEYQEQIEPVSLNMSEKLRHLKDDFKLLAQPRIQYILAEFEWRYGPAYKALKDGVKKFLQDNNAEDLKAFRRQVIYIDYKNPRGQDRQRKFEVISGPRVLDMVRPWHPLPPIALRKELQWVNYWPTRVAHLAERKKRQEQLKKQIRAIEND